jgi:uncharacterized ferritin-like protein (DUF455 family)
MSAWNSLAEAACSVLAAADPALKASLTRSIAEAWRSGEIAAVGAASLPERPARPERPPLLAPREMPKRGYAGDAGRIALIHALAHIELNAIDLAWDIVARFTADDLPDAFYDDWVQVALDEALHFDMLNRLLADLGSEYGALPAHDGLWQAATKTADDVLARLAVVPMTLEARGLDTTPATAERLRRNGDAATADALEVIYRDEIAHVAAGCRWFKHVCGARGLDPARHFAALLRRLFPGGLKPPFNHEARAEAGFPRAWYEAAAARSPG